MIRILARHPGGKVESVTEASSLPALLQDPQTIVWVDAEGEPQERLEALSRLFQLHPVTLDDFINQNQRPKIEEFDHYLFLVIHALRGIHRDELETDELHIALTAHSLFTVHDLPIDALKRTVDRCLADIRGAQDGASFFLYLLSDAVVDAYFPILDALSDEIDALEDAVIGARGRTRIHRIFEMKRVLVHLRKIVSPQREVYNALSRRDCPLIDARMAVYFRDIHDHLVRAFELIDSHRDLVANTLDAHLAAVSNRLGQVMKQLTLIATIFMPLSFLTGFFGMNFTRIPFDKTGLLVMVLAVMGGLPVAMLLLFARRGWLSDGRPFHPWSRLRAWLRRRR
jgi:magnesium transporter